MWSDLQPFAWRAQAQVEGERSGNTWALEKALAQLENVRAECASTKMQSREVMVAKKDLEQQVKPRHSQFTPWATASAQPCHCCWSAHLLLFNGADLLIETRYFVSASRSSQQKYDRNPTLAQQGETSLTF
eukprot:4313530-Pleurochrysis_carterae.AAC.2